MKRSVMTLGFLLLACGTVEVPQTQFYRLSWPVPSAGAVSQAGVLRVEELELAGALLGDRLLVSTGPVHMQAFQYHYWAGPLDRLIQDNLIAGLSRSACFARVKTAGESGGEDLVLGGRVLDFHQVVDEQGSHALVTLALHLEDHNGRSSLQREFTSSRTLNGPGPAALVIALSEAMADVLDQFLAAGHATDLFERRLTSAPGR